jgi:uracil-DNA glycosylase family 4
MIWNGRIPTRLNEDVLELGATIDIPCDGTWCINYNAIVKPEIVGTGNIKVGLLGEAPYLEEEMLGHPFVGPAGNVLREYLDLESFTYYIFNTLSCLTYVDGEPVKPSQMTQAEYETRFTMCGQNRNLILDMLDDGSVIVAFGKFAIYALFGDWKKKASDVPDFLEYNGKTFIVYSVLHPAYPLYRPSAKETGVFNVGFIEMMDKSFEENDEFLS